MKKALIKYYFNPDRPHDRKGRSNITEGPMCDVADDLLKLIHSCSCEEFNSFFLNRGRLKLKENYPTLEEHGLIMKADDDKENEYVSMVMCQKNLVLIDDTDWFIFTDWPDIAPDAPFYVDEGDIPFNIGKNMVFPIHYEAVLLCNSLKDALAPNGKNILDIFCGSGIFGVYALLNKAQSVRFIDNNVRALAFTLLNLAVNRNNYRKNHLVNVLYSNIFTSLDSDDPNNKFDLILTNPPFEPVPEGMKSYFSHSYGGEDGQFFLKLFLQNCQTYLKDTGFVVGVDFSPGMAREEHFTLKKIIDEFKATNPDWDAKPEVLDNCNLYEFASRYLALGIDIEDYHKWLFNLSKHNYIMLYFCWFIIGKNLSNIKMPDKSIKTNWANPLNWNYPCGITDKNKLPWIYLEDSFFIRENIFSQQLKNECLLSNEGRPEYFKIPMNLADKSFVEILHSFKEALRTFQYGTLGKPEKVTWMSFPEYEMSDDTESGIIFENDTHLLKSRTGLRQLIIETLKNENPKIIIFYDIYDRDPRECKTYFGDFASCTMSLFISEGKNIVYEINLDRKSNEKLSPFIEQALSKKSYSMYRDPAAGDLKSLQTYCFILEWHRDASLIFHNLLELHDKVIFDGLNKRLLFLISQGLNSLATVGLIRESSVNEAFRLEAEREVERSKREEEKMKVVLDRVYKLTNDIKNTEIVYKGGTRLSQAEVKLARLSIIDKLWNKELGKLSDINEILIDNSLSKIDIAEDVDIAFNGEKISIKHFLEIDPANKKRLDATILSLNPVIEDIISKDMAKDTFFMDNMDAFKKFLTFDDEKWWPIFGWAAILDYWKNFFDAMIPDTTFKIEQIQGKPLFMPFVAFVFGAIFQTDKGNCKLGVNTSEDGKIVIINASWPQNKIRKDETIKSLLLEGDKAVHHVRGRLHFINNIFPELDGTGFKTSGGSTSFNMIIRGIM